MERRRAGCRTLEGCPFLAATSVREFLEYLVSQRRPGAVILDFRARSDLTAELKAYNQTTPMPMGAMRNWTEAGEVLIGYSYQGRGIRESIQVIVNPDSGNRAPAWA
jgi:hypothetical protein